MGKWNKTIDLQDVWHKRNGECGPEDWTNKTVHELAKEIARRIKNKFSSKMEDGSNVDYELVDIYDHFLGVDTEQQWQKELDYLTENGTDEDFRMHNEYPPIEQFDEAMAAFFDWADSNRVWINR